MYKNQLQELAQRSCFNLPSYQCIREGPDHAPRFKAVVNFNGETFESPTFCTTLRQAEHAAAEAALSSLSKHGPSRSLTARVLDETGVYKNLLQETSHRAGLNLPVYTTVRSGPGHTPIFICTVDLAGMSFVGDPAKTKKQAQKNAAMSAWSTLKQLSHFGVSSSSSQLMGSEGTEEQEQVIVAQTLAKLFSSDGSKPSARNDRQRGRRRPVSVREDTKSSGKAHSFLTPPCQGWVQSNFFPDIAMYQIWQQDQSCHSRKELPQLPSPAPDNDCRNSPCMHSLNHPTQIPYILATDQDPLSSFSCSTESLPSSSLIFSVYPSQVPQGIRTPAEIQKTLEEKRQELGCSGISETDRGSPNVSVQLKSLAFPQYEDSTTDLLMEHCSYPEVLESQKTTKANGWSNATQVPSYGEAKISNTISQTTVSDSRNAVMPASGTPRDNLIIRERTGNQREDSEWRQGELNKLKCQQIRASQNSLTIDSLKSVPCFNHPSPTTATCYLGAPGVSRSMHCSTKSSSGSVVPVRGAGSSQGVFRPRASFLAPPVRMRTAIPVCSARPVSESAIGSSSASSFVIDSFRSVRSPNPAAATCYLGAPGVLRCPTKSSPRSVVPVSGAGSSQGVFRPRAPFLAPPVTVRTAIPVCSARPASEAAAIGSSSTPSSNKMASAVHVRPAIPVSTPMRQLTSHQRNSHESNDISEAASQLGKLGV